MLPPHPDRRALLQAIATLTLSTQAGRTLAQSPGARAPSPIPLPGPAMTSPPVLKRTPGKAGDFDFLNGHWAIRHQRKRAERDWDFFEGEASCFGILGGIASIEELRIPARNFGGMGLRLLDVKQQLWSDFWVNAASGVLAAPGTTGSFEGGAGIFESDDEDDGRPIKVRGVWDRITPNACRWQQGLSRDGGKTWEVNWSMDWVRKA